MGKAINSSGQVVGAATTASGQQHAFLYSGGKLTDLTVLTGIAITEATGINDLGQIIADDGSGHSYILSPPPYSMWQATKFTAADITAGFTTMTTDFDNDGLLNLLEYAFGTAPKTVNSSPVTVSVNANHLQITFPCNASSTDINYTVQSSNNLSTWTDIAISVGGTPTVPVNSLSTVADSGKDLRSVTVTDSHMVPASGRQFLRVTVTVP